MFLAFSSKMSRRQHPASTPLDRIARLDEVRKDTPLATWGEGGTIFDVGQHFSADELLRQTDHLLPVLHGHRATAKIVYCTRRTAAPDTPSAEWQCYAATLFFDENEGCTKVRLSKRDNYVADNSIVRVEQWQAPPQCYPIPLAGWEYKWLVHAAVFQDYVIRQHELSAVPAIDRLERELAQKTAQLVSVENAFHQLRGTEREAWAGVRDGLQTATASISSQLSSVQGSIQSLNLAGNLTISFDSIAAAIAAVQRYLDENVGSYMQRTTQQIEELRSVSRAQSPAPPLTVPDATSRVLTGVQSELGALRASVSRVEQAAGQAPLRQGVTSSELAAGLNALKSEIFAMMQGAQHFGAAPRAAPQVEAVPVEPGFRVHVDEEESPLVDYSDCRSWPRSYWEKTPDDLVMTLQMNSSFCRSKPSEFTSAYASILRMLLKDWYTHAIDIDDSRQELLNAVLRLFCVAVETAAPENKGVKAGALLAAVSRLERATAHPNSVMVQLDKLQEEAARRAPKGGNAARKSTFIKKEKKQGGAGGGQAQ